MRVAAYVYPGWHPTPERDRAFHPGFTEWELVLGSPPRFPGHHQPRLPRFAPYDDRRAHTAEWQIGLARAHGIDAFVYGFFWCRGKRVFAEALDDGFLGSSAGRTFPFAVMWANRLPRRVLPVRAVEAPVIADERRVRTDNEDFVVLLDTLARRYFTRPNYVRVAGQAYFSIFDTTFFVRELGREGAARAIAAARAHLAREGLPGFHLAAIDPAAEVIGDLAALGFDSVTHYVFLPEWKGPPLQDYGELAGRRAAEWSGYAARSGLPYVPSVSPGWDASPRGADFGIRRPDRYPWSPVVVGESPERFQAALERALHYTANVPIADPLVFVASWNEWSEGHYLEPDERHGNAWLEAVRAAR